MVYVPGVVTPSKSTAYTSGKRALHRPTRSPIGPDAAIDPSSASTENVAPGSATGASTNARFGPALG